MNDYIIISLAFLLPILVMKFYAKKVKRDCLKYIECVFRTNKERGINLNSPDTVIPNPDKIIIKNKKKPYILKRDPIADMSGRIDDIYD
jgi:hypothetical protein